LSDEDRNCIDGRTSLSITKVNAEHCECYHEADIAEICVSPLLQKFERNAHRPNATKVPENGVQFVVGGHLEIPEEVHG
jgi:hypothetical protein